MPLLCTGKMLTYQDVTPEGVGKITYFESLPLTSFSKNVFCSYEDCWFKNPKGGQRIANSEIKTRENNSKKPQTPHFP